MKNRFSHSWLVNEQEHQQQQQQKQQQQQYKYHHNHQHHHGNHFQPDNGYCNCDCNCSAKSYKNNSNTSNNNNISNRDLYSDRSPRTHSVSVSVSHSLQHCHYHHHYPHHHQRQQQQQQHEQWRKPHKSKCLRWWRHSLHYMDYILPITKSCYNQIVEVLLVLLLVNCLTISLTQLPLAAAYSSPSSSTSTSTSTSLQLASAPRNSNAFPSGASRHFEDTLSDRFDGAVTNSQLTDEEQKLLGLFSRQAHSIGGSAFGYNGLQVQNNLDEFGSPSTLLRSQNFKISPKPCAIGRIEGTCMFVWECIKSEGRHVGMCVDSFMFGSCCVHNYTDKIVQPAAFAYTRPTKPVGMASLNHRPPHHPHRPSITGMTTIERPHGAGTLVIRPSGPHHQGSLARPQNVKPSSTTATLSTSTPTVQHSASHWSSNVVYTGDLQSSASISSSSSTAHQQHWHLTTEPNFITKPRPPVWEKPVTLRPKPSKPSKKPINLSQQQQHMHQQHQQQQQQQQITPQTPTLLSSYSTRKPTRRPATTASTSTSTLFASTSWSSSSSSSPSSSSSSSLPSSTVMKPKPTVMTHHTKPSKLPTTHFVTTRPYSKPTTSSTLNDINKNNNSSSSSSSISSISNFISTHGPSLINSISRPTHAPITTQHKPKPTPSTSTTAAATTTTTTTASSIIKPTKNTERPITQQQHQQHHSSSPPPSSSSTLVGAGSMHDLASSPQSPSLYNLNTIESNEIIDNSDGGHVVKTISAARSECGVPVLARPETRIVGGKSAAFGRWPWQVSVRRTSFFGFSSTHRCGGALINENWIATAGHCVDDLLISQIRIRVGEYDFSHVQEQLPYIERGVARKVVHPQYNFFTYEYDLALVKLEQPLEFAPHVSPICLPQTDSLLIGMNATVTGWGRLSEGGTLPSVLQEVSVPIVSNDNCKSMFLRAGRQEFIPEIFLCAGYETGGQDSCQGDSGGPLQVKSQNGHYFLAGIISWGIGCAEANLPGVCTRISKFVPWILDNVT